MATFVSVNEAEDFISKVTNETALARFQFKIALDFGKAYHFQFIEGREDDPYGTVVDRCARIAKLCKAGSIICSGDYFQGMTKVEAATYSSFGSVYLKGLKDPCEIYFRTLTKLDSKEYLRPLLYSVNDGRNKLDGFLQIGRKLTVADIQETISKDVKPFLARELLNLPKCPLSSKNFFSERKAADQKEDFDRLFRGYVVEWELSFRNFTVENGSITLFTSTFDSALDTVVITLPSFCLDIAKRLHKDQQIKVRGCIQYVYSSTPFLNYVDLETFSLKSK